MLCFQWYPQRLDSYRAHKAPPSRYLIHSKLPMGESKPIRVPITKGKTHQETSSRWASFIQLLPFITWALFLLHKLEVKTKLRKKIAALIKNGETSISKTEPTEFPQRTVAGNGIILNGEKIIRWTQLQKLAFQIASKEINPGQEGLKRRLRYNIFHSMDLKVEEFV